MITLDTLNKIAERMVSHANSSYVVVDTNAEKLTIKLENSDGVDVTLTLIEEHPELENNSFFVLINEINYYSQDINLTSLRRHGYTDYDNGKTWQYDSNGNSLSRVIFMRTHNKLNTYSRTAAGNFENIMNDIDHVAELGYNAAQRNDDWGNAANAVQAARKEHRACLDTLVQLENTSAPIQQIMEDYGSSIAEFFQTANLIENVNQYSSFAEFDFITRYADLDANPDDIKSAWRHNIVTVFETRIPMRFNYDTCEFTKLKERAQVHCFAWHVTLPDSDVEIGVDVDFKDRFEKNTIENSDRLRKYLKHYVTVHRHISELAALI